MRWERSGQKELLLSVPKDRVLVLDTETTGLHPDSDELLQLSMMDGTGAVLFSSYIKPRKVKSWSEAQKINGITPQMVESAPVFDEIKGAVQEIINAHDLVVGYNVRFDIDFLIAAGCHMKRGSHTFDVMTEFAAFRAALDPDYRRSDWAKLGECAAFFGYQFPAHDALEDTRATLYCFNRLTGDPIYLDIVDGKTIQPEPIPKQPQPVAEKKSILWKVWLAFAIMGVVCIAQATEAAHVVMGLIFILPGAISAVKIIAKKVKRPNK